MYISIHTHPYVNSTYIYRERQRERVISAPVVFPTLGGPITRSPRAASSASAKAPFVRPLESIGATWP